MFTQKMINLILITLRVTGLVNAGWRAKYKHWKRYRTNMPKRYKTLSGMVVFMLYTDSLLIPLWRVFIWIIDMCEFESPQKDESRPRRLISRKLTENLELLIERCCPLGKPTGW